MYLRQMNYRQYGNLKDKIMITVDYKTQTLGQISQVIRHDWKKVYFGAVPYLSAMQTLESVNDKYGYDSGSSIVAYFLANASTWRGETAREIKKELNRRIK